MGARTSVPYRHRIYAVCCIYRQLWCVSFSWSGLENWMSCIVCHRNWKKWSKERKVCYTIAQSILLLAVVGPMIELGRGGEIFCTRPDRPWGVALTTHLHLASRLKKEYSYLYCPSLPSWPVLGRTLHFCYCTFHICTKVTWHWGLLHVRTSVTGVLCHCTLYSDEFHMEEAFLLNSCGLSQLLRFP